MSRYDVGRPVIVHERECPECHELAAIRGPWTESLCDRCERREARAWETGWCDGRSGTYDCRPFPSYRMFTAYERGRDAGLNADRADAYAE